MPRLAPLLALLLALSLGAPAFASPALAATSAQNVTPKKKTAIKRHVKRWTTPPGYRSPEQIEREEYRAWRRDRAFAWRHNTPRAYYYYYSSPYHYRGRFGGARVGPCWTQTPIGAVWNCGK